MNVLIDEAYKVRRATYISLNRKGKCYWAQSRGAFMNIDKHELVTMIEYLVDNIFVQAGNTIFRQGIRMPMGTDCAPLLANLYLFHYEYKHMRDLIKNMARMFTRYIDDLLTLNNPSFEVEIASIYPPELLFF